MELSNTRRFGNALTHWFSGVVRRQHRQRHFGRRHLIEALARTGPSHPPPELLGRELMRVARAEPAAALAHLSSHPDGLSAREAAARLRRTGPNEVEHEQPLPWWRHLWQCYGNPFNLLLTVLALVSWASGDIRATMVIAVMVLLSTGVRFVQEGRSHRAAEGLRNMVSNRASVLRRPAGSGAPTAAPAASTGEPAAARPGALAPAQAREIPMRDLVPGDLVTLSAGDMIPADCRVLVAKDLFVAQAAMTGESVPVEKFADGRGSGEGPLEQTSLVFMGTSVVSGSAQALVVLTGSRTYFGSLASRLASTDRAPTAFQAGVNSVSWLLIRFAMVMVPIVLLINGFTKGDWTQALLFALSVAVGLTPEMLPMIVTSTLAKGAVLLSRRKVVVKRLDAIQNFGAMDVLCTDKTGTLTQDKIALARRTDPMGQPAEAAFELAVLNSFYQTGLKNLLDHAVLEQLGPAQEQRIRAGVRKIDEIPFDFERRRMSVVVMRVDAPASTGACAPADAAAMGAARHELICKGAVEEVLGACSLVCLEDGQQQRTLPLDAAMRDRIGQAVRALNREGLRVVAVAHRDMPALERTYSVADESDMTLVGYIAFLDPPKDSAAPALQALAAHGVNVKVLTGDSEFVATRVCSQVGLPADSVLLGSQVEQMDEAALRVAVEQHRLFARLVPLHKERIVRALRANGHVVGYLGDGINDAPALRAADIGISVDSAVDIAKEAADIILLEKNLMVLDDGVIEGRTTFSNMLKYIHMTASSNFGNVLSVLVASAFLPFLPMLPLQLLVQNLLYDIAQTGIPFDRVDAELVSAPLRWDPAGIGRFMLFFGPISSLFDVSTFAIMWWIFDARTVAAQQLFQSGWFVVGLLTQTLIVHMIRTPRLPFFQSRASAPLMAMTAVIMALGVWLPMGPLAGYFKLQPLPPAYFAWLVAILIGYSVLTTVMKRFYIRRFGWQ